MKALGLAAIVAVVLVVVVMLVAGGEHGPARHTGSGDAGAQTPVASDPMTAGGVGGPADDAEAARTVEVNTLDTMAFEPSSIEVSAGETVTFRGETKQLTWRFGHARTLEYGCHEAGHYESGMHGKIRVG